MIGGRDMARLFISAARKSSGKTMVSLGLCAALRARGYSVQPFKKGPDFIDPLWLSAAAGRPCRNLDHHTMSACEIRATVARHAATADIAVIEGNKGLHDGVSLDGRDSAAALARALDAPVVLVIDVEGMTRGIAPLLRGLCDFDPAPSVAGIILNKVAGSRHESKLRQAVEAYTDLTVLGALRRTPMLKITQRHLGLIPANEDVTAQATTARVAERVAAEVDLAAVLAIARSAPALPPVALPRPDVWHGPRRRIGLATDPAFGFYYPEDLEGLEAAGCDLFRFNALTDRQLPPDLDGLLLGGGFPETHMAALEANAALRHDIRVAIQREMPVYAECGGMMYLAQGIRWQGEYRAMVGAMEAEAVMHERPQGKGYVLLEETEHAPWPQPPTAPLAAHEFHYASLEDLGADIRFAYRVRRGHGITGRADGIVTRRVLASFSHLRGVGGNRWPARFAAFVHATAATRPPSIELAAFPVTAVRRHPNPKEARRLPQPA